MNRLKPRLFKKLKHLPTSKNDVKINNKATMENKSFHRFLGQPRFKRSSLEAVSRPSWRTLIFFCHFFFSSHIGHFTVTLFFNNVCLHKASFDMFLAFTDIIILGYLTSFFLRGLSTGKEAPVTGNVDSNDFRRRTIQDSRVPATRRGRTVVSND